MQHVVPKGARARWDFRPSAGRMTRPEWLRAGASWALALALAWTCFRLTRGSGAVHLPGMVWWFLAAAIGTAALLMFGSMLGVLGPGTLSRQFLFAAGGWSLAASAGWSLHVMIGGPLSGVATFAALASAAPQVLPRHVVTLVGSTFIGLAGGWLVARSQGAPLMVACALVGGALASWLIRVPPTAGRPWLAWMIGWAVAWVGSWWVTMTLLPAHLARVSGTLEVILAFSIGGVVTGLLRARERRDVMWHAGTWGACGLLAAAGGLALAWSIEALTRTAGQASAPAGFLGLAQCVMMGLAGGVAVVLTTQRAPDRLPGEVPSGDRTRPSATA